MIKSAGILLYHFNEKKLEVFLVHPGGPFWVKKDLEAWTIPKGEFTDEDALTAAKREFKEETGKEISGKFIPLTPVKLKSGKSVHAFAVEGNVDAAQISSNEFEIEWPPHSGKKQQFPEIDKAAWFTVEEAKNKINHAQVKLIEELRSLIKDI